MAIVFDKECSRCRGSGEIAYRVGFPMSEVGPGPVPEDARGMRGGDCPTCKGSGVVDVDLEREAV